MVDSNVNKTLQPINLYAIYDELVNTYIHYFSAPNDTEAMAIVRGVMNDQNSYLFKNRSSYYIYKIASSDGFERQKVAYVDDLCPNVTYQMCDDPNYKEFLRTIQLAVQSALTSYNEFKADIREQFTQSQFLEEKLIKILEAATKPESGLLQKFIKK